MHAFINPKEIPFTMTAIGTAIVEFARTISTIIKGKLGWMKTGVLILWFFVPDTVKIFYFSEADCIYTVERDGAIFTSVKNLTTSDQIDP